MKRAKYNEVPKDYRRNYKKEAVEILKMAVICAVGIAVMILMFAKLS